MLLDQQCCGSNPSSIDVWNLTCATNDVTSKMSNVYRYELRLAQNRYEGDLAYGKELHPH